MKPPALGPNRTGTPLEEALFMRDEMANLAWAIEHRIEGPLERALRRDDRERPREGARVLRQAQFARCIDGSSHAWIGRGKTVGRGEGSSGLRFDRLLAPPQLDVAPGPSLVARGDYGLRRAALLRHACRRHLPGLLGAADH